MKDKLQLIAIWVLFLVGVHCCILAPDIAANLFTLLWVDVLGWILIYSAAELWACRKLEKFKKEPKS